MGIVQSPQEMGHCVGERRSSISWPPLGIWKEEGGDDSRDLQGAVWSPCGEDPSRETVIIRGMIHPASGEGWRRGQESQYLGLGFLPPLSSSPIGRGGTGKLLKRVPTERWGGEGRSWVRAREAFTGVQIRRDSEWPMDITPSTSPSHPPEIWCMSVTPALWRKENRVQHYPWLHL